MAFDMGNRLALMAAICEALGLENVNKLVLEFSVDSLMKCYAVTYPTSDRFNALAKLVADVVVSDRAEVVTTPLPMSDTARMLASAVLAGELEASRALADEIVAECGGK